MSMNAKACLRTLDAGLTEDVWTKMEVTTVNVMKGGLEENVNQVRHDIIFISLRNIVLYFLRQLDIIYRETKKTDI